MIAEHCPEDALAERGREGGYPAGAGDDGLMMAHDWPGNVASCRTGSSSRW